jgi:hypothetical protein
MAAVDDLIGAVDYGIALGDDCFFGQLLGCPWGVGLAEALTMALRGMGSVEYRGPLLVRE